MQMWTVVLSEEAAEWLDTLTDRDLAIATAAIDRLRTQGNQARMPLSRSLGEGLHELRFNIASTARRITYTYDTGRKIITLTTFRKQKQNERREVLRARRAQADYENSKE